VSSAPARVRANHGLEQGARIRRGGQRPAGREL
jgi:hypothetical protein